MRKRPDAKGFESGRRGPDRHNLPGPRPDRSRPEEPRTEQSRPDQPRPEKPWSAKSRPEKPRPEKAWPEKARPEKARPEKSWVEPREGRPKPAPVAPSETERSPASGGTWLYGHHAVLAALRNPARKILRIIATAEVIAELGPTLTSASEHAIEPLARETIARLLPGGAVHQGLAVLVRPLRSLAVEDLIETAEGRSSAIILVLDQVTDPHNVGAVLRSAAAFGALAVIMPERSAPDISGVLAKAASGALEHVPLLRVVNLVRALEMLQGAGFWTVGLAGEAEKSLATLGLTGRIVLVLGSEGEGLRRLTREACDHLARLPTKGAVDSLNVSNAAAVALYELVRLTD